MRLLSRLLAIILLFVVVYLFGPHPQTPIYQTLLPDVPAESVDLEKFIANQEAKRKVKPDNEARIVWANDSLKQKTDYAIVYLHGFSASQEEGNPVHRNIAKQFGCNLYLARLSEHGIDTSDALLNMTAESLWKSSKLAYSIGKKLGKKVILMATSTGGTLALNLAANYPEIAGLVLMSPNIAVKDPNAWLLNDPWGLQIARLVKQSNMNTVPLKSASYQKYWNTVYRLEALVEMEELVESTMTEANFAKIKQPILTLYYYKNEKEQDQVVKVSAMKKMMKEIATPVDQKKMVPIPNAANHVLASPIQSKDVVSVEKEIANFLQTVLQLK